MCNRTNDNFFGGKALSTFFVEAGNHGSQWEINFYFVQDETLRNKIKIQI
jgi:hypothetical protein